MAVARGRAGAAAHPCWPPSRLPCHPGTCLRPKHAGLASLRLEYDAGRNPAIFDQLLAQTPVALIARGQPILEEQQRQVQAAVGTAFEVALGGAAGGARGWGRCLAVRVGDGLAGLRSQLGNALAEESKARGLRPVAVVAYIEVGGWVQWGCGVQAGPLH